MLGRLLCFLALLVTFGFGLAGCSGGGGGGGGVSATASAGIATRLEVEPNDLFDDATAVEFGVAGVGETSSPGDVDFWSFFGEAGQVFEIELHGLTLDSQGWAGACTSPRLQIYGPGDELVLHTDNSSFVGPTIDLDLPFFMVSETGIHTIRVSTHSPTQAGGRYALRVTPYESEVQTEQEPYGVTGLNDSPEDAEPINSGLIWGDVSFGSADSYEIAISQPTQFWIEVFGQRAGRLPDESGELNPFLIVRNELGVLVDSAGDSFYRDPAVSFFAPAGTYTIQVLQSGGAQNGGEYFLRVRTFDRSQVTTLSGGEEAASAPQIQYAEFVQSVGTGQSRYFSFEAEAGDVLRLEMFWETGPVVPFPTASVFFVDPDGAFLSSNRSQSMVRALVRESGRHTIRVSYNAGHDFAFRLLRWRRSLYQEEVGNSSENAAELVPSLSRSGFLTDLGDEDWYRIAVKAGELSAISLYASSISDAGAWIFNGHGSTLIPRLELFDEDGELLTRSLMTGLCGRGARLSQVIASLEVAHVAEVDGVIYARVSGHEQVGPHGHYLIEFSRP